MVTEGFIADLDGLRVEVNQVFRRAGYIRPAGADYLALSTTCNFPHTATFRADERKINMHIYLP